jgi:uncharacterized protein
MSRRPEGKWAIVTGASSGIGRALAYEFAAGGFNLLLTARNAAALTEIADECARQHGVETDVVVADLSISESVESLVAGLDRPSRRFEVLVNNAGFGIHGDFGSTDIDECVRLLNLQLTAALRLTRAVLPAMIQRRSGRILNVASVYSWSPVPFQSVYAACKAFLWSFSSSIQEELAGTGVTVTVFCPGVTQTEFRSRAGIEEKRRDSGMTAQEAAHIAYGETLKGKHLVIPGFLNRLFVFFAKRLPSSAVPPIVRFINRRRLN